MTGALREYLDEAQKLRATIRRAMDPTRFVLIIEDDPSVAAIIGKHLKCCGHRTKTAATYLEALEVILNEAKNISFAVIDLMIPGGSGEDLVTLFEQTLPEVPYCVHTGSSQAAGRICKEHPRARVLIKGASLDALVDAAGGRFNA